jgi:hypothetical protein
MLELMMLIKSIIYANAIKIDNNETYIIVLTFLSHVPFFHLYHGKVGIKRREI